jgi:phosphoglycolate phosphatase
MRTILLDLDGTLVDSAPGIIRCLRETLMDLGHPGPSDDDLLGVVGPPLRTAVRHLLGEDADVEDAIRRYRERYAAGGMFDAKVFPGMSTFLGAARTGGFRIFVCTAKLTTFANRILEHFGLADALDGVFGAEADGRFDDKADLVAHMQTALGFEARDTCMIGDRREDVLASGSRGVRSIGALWGYGGEAELRLAGASVLCRRPTDLLAAVTTMLPQGRRAP